MRQSEYRAELRLSVYLRIILSRMVLKEMTLALMSQRINHVCNKLIKMRFNRIFDPAALY